MQRPVLHTGVEVHLIQCSNSLIRLCSSQHSTQGFSRNCQASDDISAAPIIKRSAKMNKADFYLNCRTKKRNCYKSCHCQEGPSATAWPMTTFSAKHNTHCDDISNAARLQLPGQTTILSLGVVTQSCRGKGNVVLAEKSFT